MKTTINQQNVKLASKLLRLNEQRMAEKKANLTEGTPTTALTPDTDATRQMQKDMAQAAAKGGVPAPVGAEPRPDHGETAMGTQNPMGADAPARVDYSQGGQQDGMVRPSDQRGDNYNAGPGSPTQSEKGNLQQKGMSEDEINNLSTAGLIEAFVLLSGGLDEAIFSLLAGGVSLQEAEAALLDGEEMNEGLIDKIKSTLASKKAPSSGYQKHLEKRKQASSGVTFVNKTTPSGPSKKEFSSFRREGPTARSNK